MIAFLEGLIEKKTPGLVILNVNGIGYEINVPLMTYEKLPQPGNVVRLYISESTGLYGGGTTYYGFLTPEEKNIFVVFKDGLKNTGAKKALEYLDKAMKSLPDFQKAVIDRNTKFLISIFGFKLKTAEKIVALLSDKFSEMDIPGKKKWVRKTEADIPSDAIQALVALGYRESQVKKVVEQILSETEEIPKTEDLIKTALKYMNF